MPFMLYFSPFREHDSVLIVANKINLIKLVVHKKSTLKAFIVFVCNVFCVETVLWTVIALRSL